MSTQIPDEVRNSWPPPNYNSPETRATALLGVMFSLTILTLMVIAGRIYSRAVICKSMGGDDWWMLASTIVYMALAAVIATSTTYGWGLHTWDYRPEWAIPVRKLAFATQILFVFSTNATKTSILVFYLRVWSTGYVRKLSWLGLILVGSSTIGFFFAVLFQCLPIEAYWDLNIPRKCVNQTVALIFNGTVNVFTDFYVFLLPIRSIAKLRLPERQRIGLLVVFALGFLTCLAGACRIWGIVKFRHSYDISWEGALLYIFSLIEAALGIICASIPALKPIVAHHFPSSLGRTSNMSKELNSGTLGGIKRSSGFPLRSLVPWDPRFDMTAIVEAGRDNGPESNSSQSNSSRGKLKNDKSIGSTAANDSEECIIALESSYPAHAPNGIGKKVQVEVTVENYDERWGNMEN
ncbi:hypothetical protein BDZ91DRAFT_676987 [Kalaharituber pfeilii]|nr:hypothetical protein BDZ91DRAFT_676987 [Kalaharituber pfeilii]